MSPSAARIRAQFEKAIPGSLPIQTFDVYWLETSWTSTLNLSESSLRGDIV